MGPEVGHGTQGTKDPFGAPGTLRPLWGPQGICEAFHDKGLFRSEGRKFFRDKLISGGLGP